MLTNNPFAELSAHMTPGVMQTYVIVMVILVVAGTLFDVIHKKSARYFFENWRSARSRGSRQVGGGEVLSMAIQTFFVEVLTSAEFCTTRRRIAHLLTMYGFVAYAVTTAIMVFCYPTSEAEAPTIVPALWHIGALMVCVGGYWFWFVIRADVSAEGNSPFRVVHADLFIPTTVLFGSVPWSKFAHMFFKPAAALQKRVAEADGSRSNLPPPADKPEVFGSARRLPENY